MFLFDLLTQSVIVIVLTVYLFRCFFLSLSNYHGCCVCVCVCACICMYISVGVCAYVCIYTMGADLASLVR